MSWSDKHSPKVINELIGQDVKALINHAKLNPKGKALLIHGPVGCGKTSSVYALALSGDYEIIEVNSSSSMNAESIKSIVGNACVTNGFFGKRVILIDDIDSLSSSDRGGVAELISCIKKTMVPLFLTCIDPWDPKLRSLRSYCNLVEFSKINASLIKGLLKRVCDIEGVIASDKVLYSIASHANGDVRGAINNLEMLAGDGEITERELELMGYREKTSSIFTGLQRLFRANGFSEALHSLDDVDIDLNDKLLWINENLPKEFKGVSLSSAYNFISRSDVFNGRISRRQYWNFLFYVNLFMTAGVKSVHKSFDGFIKYSSPSKIISLGRTKVSRELRKSLGFKLKSSFNSSLKKSISELSSIKLLLKNSDFALNYELTSDEVKIA